MNQLTHIDAKGAASMVDVGDKDITDRLAVAVATVVMRPDVLALLVAGQMPKGDVLAVARIAGIQGAKKTAELIPLCHPLMLSKVSIDFAWDESIGQLHIRCTCRVRERTGVEMEALTGASVAALTIYDMCKAAQRDMCITNVRLLEKSGGRSGDWQFAS